MDSNKFCSPDAQGFWTAGYFDKWSWTNGKEPEA